MKLSIIIPCFNELSTIEEIISNVKNEKNYSKEIIVIDDGSTDGTRDILKNKFLDKVDHIIYNDKNHGKGYSIRKGIKLASGDILIIQDADLEYDPSDYSKLVEPIKNGYADVVYGSRFVGTDQKRVLNYWHSLGNYWLTLLSNMLTNINLTDMEVCYKAFKSEHIKKIELKENRFGFEPEITAKIAKKKLRVYEVGIKYFGRTYNEGKKIGWKDGISAIRCIIFYNLFS
ncbi:glycosyltransferase family 2 protein [Candidatus Pelagibacter sp.]|nr:glycosyltransferase family 2 protein [Candidatus Pelagibacter sp.]MDC1070569.1 glycosyltransferase family 2 protein [Candidatus Pelagibacter sp.]